ncbi:GNAT family N-acetyltransferase [Mesorhizobium sp. PL10]
MTTLAQPQHDLSAIEIDAFEDRIYAYNREAVGRDDAQGLGFVIRDPVGRIIGAATGFSWAGTSELKQMWIDEGHRGRGYARALLNAFAAEAKDRGVRRIWVQSHDFQAPGMYEKAGFVRVAEFADWPEGHSNVILCKILEDPTATQ